MMIVSYYFAVRDSLQEVKLRTVRTSIYRYRYRYATL